ncbi:MAG: carbohydrate binding family 9 domain-containing protein, partial [Bacteroidota bacterium]
MKYLFPFLILLTSILRAGNNPLSMNALRTPAPPVIDGYGNDEAWRHANSAVGFVQRDPNEGAPATEQTEVKILYDDRNLYLYAMMADSSPEKIVARLSRRDNDNESDYFAVGFDSYNDKQTSFIFIVSASGSKYDAINFNDGRDEDASWDPVWESEVRILPN